MKPRAVIMESLRAWPKDATFTLDALGEFMIEELAAVRFGPKNTWPADLWDIRNRELSDATLIAALAEYTEEGFSAAIAHDARRATIAIHAVRACLWALDHPLATWAADDANYPNFGLPILRRVAESGCLQLSAEVQSALTTWKDGEKCRPDCDKGCGQ